MRSVPGYAMKCGLGHGHLFSPSPPSDPLLCTVLRAL